MEGELGILFLSTLSFSGPKRSFDVPRGMGLFLELRDCDRLHATNISDWDTRHVLPFR